MDSLETDAAAGAEAGGSHSDSRVATAKHSSPTMSHPPAMDVDSDGFVGGDENNLVSDAAGTLPSGELNG